MYFQSNAPYVLLICYQFHINFFAWVSWNTQVKIRWSLWNTHETHFLPRQNQSGIFIGFSLLFCLLSVCLFASRQILSATISLPVQTFQGFVWGKWGKASVQIPCCRNAQGLNSLWSLNWRHLLTKTSNTS